MFIRRAPWHSCPTWLCTAVWTTGEKRRRERAFPRSWGRVGTSRHGWPPSQTRGSVRRLLHHAFYADPRSELEPMMNRHLTPINGNGGARRRRPPRPLPLYALLPEPRPAAARGAAAAARE